MLGLEVGETLKIIVTDSATKRYIPSWCEESGNVLLQAYFKKLDFKYYYLIGGLPPAAVDILAGYCVFGTTIRNESAHPVSYQVPDWRYITDEGRQHPVKTKTDWIDEWRDQGWWKTGTLRIRSRPT